MAHFLRNKHRLHDPVWHVQVAMLGAIGLQLALPDRYIFGSHLIIPILEFVALLALSLTTPKEKIFRSLARRVNALVLIILSSVANAYALIVITNQLVQGGHISNGRDLILTSINIYLTNIILFALWYWEMDGGGPGQRELAKKHEQDFIFQQQRNEDFKHPNWRPTFTDYLYTSSTNAMTFGPTDTMPMSRRAKMLMLAQSTISLIAIALVAARAVGILG